MGDPKQAQAAGAGAFPGGVENKECPKERIESPVGAPTRHRLDHVSGGPQNGIPHALPKIGVREQPLHGLIGQAVHGIFAGASRAVVEQLIKLFWE